MIIELKGTLDTSKISEVKEYIDAQMADLKPAEHLVFDCKQLDYISSSGLRILLAVKKIHADMEIVNVSRDVYSVFEMTGFTRIFDIHKVLRRIDLENCIRLAHGANGEVYKINEEEIVKLTLFADREDELVDEINRAREAFVLGVPTMISYEVVEVNDGRKGIVMEALNSTTLAQHLKEHPEQLDSYIEPYVDLFRTTNSIVVEPGKFYSTKQHLLDRLLIPENILGKEVLEGVKSLVEALPDGNNIIHADGHPSNALLCGDEDSRNLILIDMGDVSAGHPIFEIMGWAFLMNSTEFGPSRIIGPLALGLDYDFLQTMFRKMLASYLKISDEKILDKAVDAAAYVGLLRFICVDQIRARTPEKQERNRRIAKMTLEHRKDVLDAIDLLTELIDRSR